MCNLSHTLYMCIIRYETMDILLLSFFFCCSLLLRDVLLFAWKHIKHTHTENGLNFMYFYSVFFLYLKFTSCFSSLFYVLLCVCVYPHHLSKGSKMIFVLFRLLCTKLRFDEYILVWLRRCLLMCVRECMYRNVYFSQVFCLLLMLEFV